MKQILAKSAYTFSILASVLSLTNFAGGDTIDPRGVFFHNFTGPFSAIEWVDFRAKEGIDRYQFSDIRGLAPFQGLIDCDGQITWDNTGMTSGSGSFSDQDNATMTLNFSGSVFESTLRRAPGTDAEFITQLDSRTNGNSLMNGQWNLTVKELDPASGSLLGESMTTASVETIGDLLRVTYDDGTYFQGVFEDSDHAGFRVVLPAAGLTDEFASFDGSETSLDLNLLGDFRYLAANDSFSAVFLTQTRNAPGQQLQSVFSITATRAVPEPGGLLLAIATIPFLLARRKDQRD